jgi:L-iditol 2-dehydrogenase
MTVSMKETDESNREYMAARRRRHMTARTGPESFAGTCLAADLEEPGHNTRVSSDGLMNVVVHDGPNRTRLRSVARPHAGPGELVLDLVCCGLCGTDLFKLAGDETEPGTVLGHELVGTVAEVGRGLDGFRPGDRVVVPHHVSCGACPLCRRGSETRCEAFRENLLAPGGFAESIRVLPRAASIAARVVPASVSSESASFMEPAACVLRGMRRSGLLEEVAPDPDPRVAVVLGAGSMGLLHLLVLRAALPGCRIVLSDPVESRRALAVELGADAASRPGSELVEVVRQTSEGRGADAVFDTVGGAALLDEGIGLIRLGGTVILFAHAGRGERASFDLNSLFKGEMRVVSTYSGTVEDQARVFEMIVSGALDPSPLVTHWFPLSRFDEAVALAADRAALKVMIVPDDRLSR